MPMNRWLPFFAAAAALCAQDYGPDIDVPGQQMMSGQGALRASGVLVRYKTMISATGNAPVKRWNGVGGGLNMENDHVTRTLMDPHDGSWFGYDIGVSGDSASGFLLTFGPPTGKGPRGAVLMSIPKYPVPQSIHDGDTVAVDLMVSADGTQKLTDYVQIISPEKDPQPKAATTTAAPRDFTLDDGPVEFNIRRFVVLHNGQQLETGGYTGRPGATFWIGLPNEGRYILSLVPHDGFTKSGAVRDNVISFDAAGLPCEIRFLTPIAGAGNAWNLYVLHDPAWLPKPALQGKVITGTARLDELLSGRI
jgi:hypothetical protein